MNTIFNSFSKNTFVAATAAGMLLSFPAHAESYKVTNGSCTGYKRAGKTWLGSAGIPAHKGQVISADPVAGRSDIVYWTHQGTVYSVPMKCLVAASGAPVEDADAPPAEGSRGYGDAGCGLGAVIFGNQPGPVQIFAATTNGIYGNQTSGITSGTSRCGSGGAAPTVREYIDANRPALANDIARGKGETLDGLVNLLGCKDSTKAGEVLQADYPRIFPDNKVNSAGIEASIKKSLNGSCS